LPLAESLEGLVLKPFPALVFVLAIAGCSTLDLQRPVARDDIAHIKKIGVASFLGDTVYGISMGTTAYNNEEFSAAVPDWKVDATAVSYALTILRGDGRFEAAPFDRSSYTGAQLGADNGKLFWDLVTAQGFDTLVILWPEVPDNFRVFKPGYGLFERSFLGLSNRCLYAAYRVEVDNVASRKVIAWEWGGDQGVPCLAGSENRLDFKAKFDDYSDAEKQAIREGIEARISETLGKALTTLGLASPAKVTR
jgi:hypothetical protein